MKNNKINFVVFVGIIFALLYLSSCGGGGSNQQYKPVMNCMINSSTWRTSDPHARVSDNSIVIYGTSANGQTIQLRLYAGEQGEYSLNPQTRHEGKFIPNLSTSVMPYSTSYNTAGSGFVNVNSINDEAKTISGTFGFKAYREHDGTYKSISEGRFSNVPFKYISTVDTSSFDNYMHAIINDQAWSALTVNAVKNDTAIIITGNNSENWEKLKIIIPNNIGAGVQTITASGPVFTIFEQGFHTYHGSAGSVTIAEHNQETQIIKASFFFNFVNEGGVTISITSGQFEALYIDETEN